MKNIWKIPCIENFFKRIQNINQLNTKPNENLINHIFIFDSILFAN